MYHNERVTALQQKLQQKFSEPLPPDLAHAMILGAGIMRSPSDPLTYFVVLRPFRRHDIQADTGVILVKGRAPKNPDKRFRDSQSVITITHQLQFSTPCQNVPGIPGVYLPMLMRHSGGTIPLGRYIATDPRQDGRFVEWYGWEPNTYQSGQYFYFLDTEVCLRVFALVDAEHGRWAHIRAAYANPISLVDVRAELLAEHGDQILNYDRYVGEPPLGDFS